MHSAAKTGGYIASLAALTLALGCGPVGTAEIGDPCADTRECVPNSICFRNYCVGDGALRVSLAFTANSDFDLHLVTPNGAHIYWNNKEDDGGILDVDQCVTSGGCTGSTHVENIVFSAAAPDGQYQVWVRNYDGRAGGTFEIEVDGQVTNRFTGTLGATVEDSDTFTFTK